MKVSLIQMQAGADKQANLAKAEAFVLEAAKKKARFILLPEVFSFRGKISESQDLLRVAEPFDGETLGSFKKIARDFKAFILAGSFYEKAGRTQKAYNTSAVINDRGAVAVKYRKAHLFKAQIKGRAIDETRFFLPGKEGALTRIQGFSIGLGLCYDLRFPEFFREYAHRGVDVLCVPAAFTKTTGQAHWEVLVRARAIENLAYVLAPNQVGIDEKGYEAYGHSLVVDPWGRILARGTAGKEEILYADIFLSAIKKVRASLPFVL